MNTRVSKKIHGFLGFLIDLTIANALHLLTLKTNPMAFYRRTKNPQVWSIVLPNDVTSIHLPVLHLCATEDFTLPPPNPGTPPESAKKCHIF